MGVAILIVEDHPLYRQALLQVTSAAFAQATVVASGSVEEAIRAAAPDSVKVVLLDLQLPGVSGTEAISVMRRVYAGACILVVSASEERRDACACIGAGAMAVISKSAPTDVLLGLAREAFAARLSLPQWITPSGAPASYAEQRPVLTARQCQILRLLCEGRSNREIGLVLGLAVITVKQHLSAIFRVLGAVNRTQAVLAARNLGIC